MRIVEALPSTNFERPSADQLRGLARIVFGHYPKIEPCSEREFALAFQAIGLMWRLPAPDTRQYFRSHVDSANDLLQRLGLGDIEIEGNAVLAAIVAHGDIKFRLANRAIGQMLEIGLSPLSGLPCSTPNAWRAVLATGRLLSPTPPSAAARGLDATGREVPRPRIYEEEPGGAMREVAMPHGEFR